MAAEVETDDPYKGPWQSKPFYNFKINFPIQIPRDGIFKAVWCQVMMSNLKQQFARQGRDFLPSFALKHKVNDIDLTGWPTFTIAVSSCRNNHSVPTDFYNETFFFSSPKDSILILMEEKKNTVKVNLMSTVKGYLFEFKAKRYIQFEIQWLGRATIHISTLKGIKNTFSI